MNVADLRIPLERLSLAELLKPSRETSYFGKRHLGRAPVFNGANLGSLVESFTGQSLTDPEIEDLLFDVQVPMELYCQGYDLGSAVNYIGLGAGIDSPGPEGYYKWSRCEEGALSVETQYATDAQQDAFEAYWSQSSGPRLSVLSFSSSHSPYDKTPTYPDHLVVRVKYERVCQYLDDQIGAVMNLIDLNHTFVVLLGDNGTPNDARPIGSPSGIWKGSAFEGGVHVPFAIAGSGITQGCVSQRLVSCTDLPKTLAELLGVPIQRGFEDSQSFANDLGLWTGSPPRDFVFCEKYGPLIGDQQAIIESGLKLIRTNQAADAFYTLPGDVPAPGMAQTDKDRLLGRLDLINTTIPRPQ